MVMVPMKNDVDVNCDYKDNSIHHYLHELVDQYEKLV